MGSTFAAVHVRTTDLAGVAGIVDGLLRAQGLIPADEGEEGAADRVVAITPGATWTAVYDEAADIGDDAVLDAVGGALSQGVTALAVLVHDSDVLQLRLYQGGKKRAFYDSNPGYFTGRLQKARPKKHIQAFAPVLPDGVDTDALRPIFTSDSLFAEQAVDTLAGVIGADPGRLSVGYRYQEEQGWPEGTVLLRYRDPAGPVTGDGPPVFATHAPGHSQPVAVGGELTVTIGLKNEGGPMSGAVINVAGATDVVTWTEARISTAGRHQVSTVAAPLVDGVAQLAVDVPGGLPQAQLMGLPPQQLLKRLHQGVIYVHVRGIVDRPGTAPVQVGLSLPDGTLLHEQTLSVTGASTEGRPLRASPQVAPAQLAQLDDDRWLNALVCCALPRDQAIARLLPIVQAMQPHLPTDGKVTRTIFPAAGGGLMAGVLAGMKSPKLWTGKAAGLWRGKGWSKLVDTATTTMAQVELAWGEAEEGPGEGVARLSLGSGLVPAPGPATALALSLHRPGPEVAAALHQAIDAAVAQGGIAQASLTRSGTAASTEMTLYELCCSISGQCTLMNRWVTRWLRCVGPGALWVGPSLQTHLEGSTLAWEQVGDSWRLEVTDRADVEPALAAILPSAEDWQRGMALRYAP